MHTRNTFKDGDAACDAAEAQWMRELAARGPSAEAAWDALFRAYGQLFVKRLAWKFHPDTEKARDVAQELWIEIARSAHRWPENVPVRIWLRGFLRIAWLRDLDEREERSQLKSIDVEAVLVEVETLLSSGASTPEDWFDFVRCVRRVFGRFETAHPNMAQLLLLRHVEEMSLEEIAELLGGDANLAKSRVYSARQLIGPDLHDCLELWPNWQRGNDERDAN